ncbi:MAG: hypothetical protein M0P09_01385 [Acholeplasmataceae bacterium]|nr:hypothetical protein [Acholeplasmataceae bacterium]
MTDALEMVLRIKKEHGPEVAQAVGLGASWATLFLVLVEHMPDDEFKVDVLTALEKEIDTTMGLIVKILGANPGVFTELVSLLMAANEADMIRKRGDTKH